MPIHGIEMRGNFSVYSQLRVEVADELMAVEIEIHPERSTSALGAADNFSIELARFGDVPHLQSDVEGCQGHGHQLIPSEVVPSEDRSLTVQQSLAAR